MNDKYVMANFKMNKTDSEIQEYFKVLVPATTESETKIVVGVPFTSLKTARELTKDSNVMIVAENMNENEKGAFTGEVSADMLSDLNIDGVIIGHSERRNLYLETNEVINKKILRALKSNLISIFCIGETLYERKNQLTEEVLQKQINEGLKGIYANELKNIIIAYEPVWAIGTGVVPMDVEIIETLKLIRSILASMYDEEIAKSVIVTYGGSVNDENCKDISKLEGVDGALVGGASLKPEKFIKIINAFKPKKSRKCK